MSKSFMYGTDSELYTAGGRYSTMIQNAPTTYGLVAADATRLSDAYTAYASAYEAATAPETRTKGKVAAKNAARKIFKEIAIDLAKKIDGTSTVTDEQKIDLGLSVRKPPQPVGRPTVRPGVDLTGTAGRTLSLHVHDSTTSGKRGKPAGVAAAWFYSFVGPEYPSDAGAWQFEGAATRNEYQITFADTVPSGAQVWICAAWVNRKGEAGPTSAPLTANLQGGSVAPPKLKMAA